MKFNTHGKKSDSIIAAENSGTSIEECRHSPSVLYIFALPIRDIGATRAV